MPQLASPRSDVQVRFPDGIALNAAPGTTIETFIQTYLAQTKAQLKGQVVAALVNGKLRELTLPLSADSEITPVTMADSDGMRLYTRSLSFLMVVATRELFPDCVLTIHHSLPYGGYYCELDERKISEPEIAQLAEKMRELVAADLPITRRDRVPLSEALDTFRQNGDGGKADLFTKRRRDYITLYELNGIRDYFHGFMVPSTGYLNIFDLMPYVDGFVMRFPRRGEPDNLKPIRDAQWLADIFQNYGDWLKLIGASNVPSLNSMIEQGRMQEVILVAEALHRRQLGDIADEISSQRDKVSIVLISGPSSAGKTTFSKRLAVELLARGIHPVAVGLDNYFVDRDKTPRDATGDYDFEHVEAVDIPLFTQHLAQLLNGETITQPRYNFLTGSREWDGPLKLRDDQMLIIEGIHGLNPRLVEGISADNLYRIFINPFTQLNFDKHNRVPTTDSRKLRRIVRDYYHRGYSAADTLRRWPKVRAGEKDWIYPYQTNANRFFNSALVYELPAIKRLAEPILLQVEPDTPERVEANRLRANLQWFEPLTDKLMKIIPSDSLLREFVGGSIMEDFEPWVN